MGRSGRSLLLILLTGSLAPIASANPTSESTTPANAVQQVSGNNGSAVPTEADLKVDVLQAGASTRAVREQARKILPLAQLNADQQRTANAVLSDVSLFRRLPTVRCPIDPKVYQFFIDHPDVAVSVWRVLGISKLALKQTSPTTYEADTGDGSTGTLTILAKTPTQCVVHCDGMFKSPVLPKAIKARALVVLNTQFEPQADGTSIVTHSVDMFVNFPSLAVETIAKVVSPLSYKFADRNMEEITAFLRMMALSMERNPGWIEQVAVLLEGVAAERGPELIKLTAGVYVDAQRRLSPQSGSAGTAPVPIGAVQTAAGSDAGVKK